MTIKINYKNIISEKLQKNLVLFTDDNFTIKPLRKFISSNEYTYIFDLLKISDLKKKILTFELNSKRKIILISIKKDIRITDVENLGAEFYKGINYGKKMNTIFIAIV